jgi:hypothetical protein
MVENFAVRDRFAARMDRDLVFSRSASIRA